MEAFRLGAAAPFCSQVATRRTVTTSPGDSMSMSVWAACGMLKNLGFTDGRFRVESVSATEGAEVVAHHARNERHGSRAGHRAHQRGECSSATATHTPSAPDGRGARVAEVLRLSDEARLQGIA